ncbi:hypothetical protein [Cylindrospermopsis raciborskii]|uniref:hypothetical protein n=1 Tax=Cylindrospermopsis raciborskii TaxID=77022 RepID=UPI0001C16D87|nr:Alcohol dehydrogenase GroES domain protein [Cylindrospermopsis raciborskii CS-505]
MKGIWLENNQLQLRTDLPIPEPPEGEVLVKVLRGEINAACGHCRFCLEGKPPM